MADPVGTTKQVVKIVLAIRTAVQTVRRNEECREIEQLATRVSRILSRLQETESDPAMDGAMAELEKSLDRDLKLVTTCQKRSAMHRICAAGAMARQLRRVQDDILRQLMLGVFATPTQLTLSLNMLQQPGAGAPPPRSQRPSSLGAGSSRLHWSSVFQIIQGIAHGVKIRHDRFIVHLDLKPSNVLLDSDFNPKIADFGVARELNLRGNEYFDDNFVAGTIGYMAPEYYVGRPAHSMSKPEYYGDRWLTPSMSEGASLMKRDVYGFGATLLDILSGMCISEAARRQPSLEWAWNVQQASRMNFLKNNTRQMEKLFDPSLCENSDLKMIRRCIGIGLLCTQEKPNDRPTMWEILDMLDRK
ncbi:unnamed protein product [Miscanthus lutarioriparius]|uniref:Protein kinase domain-containing protein n=1 Tax=Miscanthus lutarioriparius TaxID=422564 RepID=A0A811QIB7_9POAL|nr:unnamed protein product [Miscanthus lutarioriparius]